MRVSAENICFVLRSRGLSTARLLGYESLLAHLTGDDLKVVEHHLHVVASTNEDSLSLVFMQELSLLAQGAEVRSHNEILSKLEQAIKRTASSKMEADHPVHPQGMTPAKSSMRTAQERDVSRKKHYVYGQRCAFMFELDWLKARPGDTRQKRTLTVEAAMQIAPRSYDWKGRISFQLTVLELPQFTAVMQGNLKHEQIWSVGNHGRARDKHLRAIEQADSVFLKLEQSGKRWPIRVSQEHRYQILSLAYEALRFNDEHLDLATITQLCAASLPRPV